MDTKAASLVVMVMCLFVAVSADKDCITIRPKHSLFGHNDRILTSGSLESCAESCRSESSFDCKSFDFVTSGRCYLSQVDHIDDPDMFGSHDDSTYGFISDCDACAGSDDAGNDDSASDDEDEGDQGSGYRRNLLRQIFRRKNLGK